MVTQFLTRVLTSRPSKFLIILAVLLVVASQAVPQMIDTKPYVDRIAADVKEKTGASMVVKGGVQLQLLPRPALILHTVEISQPNVQYSPTIGADIAELGIHLPSLLSGAPAVDKLILINATVISERLPTGQANWGYLGVPFLKTFSGTKPQHPLQVSIISGHVSVADVKTGTSTGITNVQLSGTLGSETAISGTFSYNEMPVTFTATRSGVIGATPVTLNLSATGGLTLSLKGSMDFTADYPLITAKMEMSSNDISNYLTPPAPADAAPKTEKIETKAVPLKLSGDYVQKEGMIQLNNLSLDTLNSQATGKAEYIKTGDKGAYNIALNFSTLDMTNIKQALTAYVQSVTAVSEDGPPKTLTDPNLTMSIDIAAEKVMNDAQQWNKANFNGTISDGMLTVNQMTLAMPGDSMVTMFGLLSVSDTQGLRFEGNTEARGESLRDLLTVFDESASNLPSLGFGAYQFKSNVFISRELMRLSEATAKFSELTLKGGLVSYFDNKKPRIESDLVLRDINFDYFRDSWRTSTSNEEKNVFLRFDRNMNFDWLKKLKASIDFRVQVEGFTFLERKGTGASFRLFAQAGEFGIYNAKFVYPMDTTEGSLKFDVAGASPSINLVLNTAVMNTNYFAHTPSAPEPVIGPGVAPEAAAVKPAEMPDMVMPTATPEEELRQKIDEEAQSVEGAAAAPQSNVPVKDPESPTAPVAAATSAESMDSMQKDLNEFDEIENEIDPIDEAAPTETQSEEAEPVELTPLAPQAISPNEVGEDSQLTTTPQSLIISDASAQEAPATLPVTESAEASRWSQELIDLSVLEGIAGNFDISVGKLQHKDRLFENFKMMAKLERNLLTFQTLTFLHWGGSFSINGTLFGGKVPGISIGFIIASADIDQILGTLLDMHGIGGRASISGTFDTSGVNVMSWISQANAKLLFAGRGVTVTGFDMASVIGAVQASRTAADVFNNVNLSIVGGTGEYSADGSINLNRGVISSPGIAMKTGRIVGGVTGDFRLIPWDINLSGVFKFPELSTENVPSIAVRWTGPVDNLSFQTDTQSLEAFVSKRIIGN